jgi:hypothetical protein
MSTQKLFIKNVTVLCIHFRHICQIGLLITYVCVHCFETFIADLK